MDDDERGRAGIHADRRLVGAMIDEALERAFEPPSDEGITTATGERRVILIDGFNVLHAVLDESERETGWWRRTQRERLLRLAAGWPIATDELWVAFDGARPAWAQWAEPFVQLESRPPRAAGGRPTGPLVHSVYVESADDWIVRRARRSAVPDRTVVVTRDRQVAGRCRSAGCVVWAPQALLAECRDAGDPIRGTL